MKSDSHVETKNATGQDRFHEGTGGESISAPSKYSRVPQPAEGVERKGLDLSEQVFSGTSLRGTRFFACNLNNTNLSKCDLTGAVFTDCSLNHTIFEAAVMENSSFFSCSGYFTDLRQADLSGAVFRHSSFYLSDLRKAKLKHTELEASHFDLSLTEEAEHLDTVKAYLNGATHEESERYEEQLKRKLQTNDLETARARQDFARNWIQKVESGAYDRTNTYRELEQRLKETAVQNNTMHAQRSSVTEAIKDHIDLLDYAGRNGYTVVPMGKQYGIKEMDSVRFFRDDDHPGRYLFHRHSSDRWSGSVIDFHMMIHHCSQQRAISELRKILPQRAELVSSYHPTANFSVTHKRPRAVLILPPKAKRFQELFAYLIRTRGIHKAIVSDLVRRGLMYQDRRKNCVFVGMRNQGDIPELAFKRSTNTQKDYRGLQAGSQNIGWFVDNGRDKKLVITESCIDALSFMTNEIDAKRSPDDYSYLAANGTSTAPVTYRMEHCKPAEIMIATDNDPAGKDFRKKIVTELGRLGYAGTIKHLNPSGKDLNEDLQNKKSLRQGTALGVSQQKQKQQQSKHYAMSSTMQPERT